MDSSRRSSFCMRRAARDVRDGAGGRLQDLRGHGDLPAPRGWPSRWGPYSVTLNPNYIRYISKDMIYDIIHIYIIDQIYIYTHLKDHSPRKIPSIPLFSRFSRFSRFALKPVVLPTHTSICSFSLPSSSQLWGHGVQVGSCRTPMPSS